MNALRSAPQCSAPQCSPGARSTPGRARWDAVVVGARAAGAATAMLLARRGLRVLAVDRAAYGSDTLSTHALMRAGVLQLHRWGVLDAVRAAGTPPVRRTTFHYADGETAAVEIKPTPGVEALYAPRRTVLDRILVDAARAAGAEVRFGIAVEGLARDAAGRVTGIVGRDRAGGSVEERAAITIGADGLGSTVARAAGAPQTCTGEARGAVVYGYFRGLPDAGYEWYYRQAASAGLIPTNDGEACVFAGTTPERFRAEVQGDLAGGFRRLLAEAAPEVAAALEGTGPSGRLRGFPGVAGFLRRPWGPGWALVGDASHFKDPLSTHGITDALRDAELLARVVEAALERPAAEIDVLAAYERERDRLSLPLHRAIDQVCRYGWTADELRGHLYAVSKAMKAEVEMLLGFDERSAAA